ncbi:MAG TPA: hypothetical protein VFX03_06495, partial [Thermomicrobiales bacterium]|nr:hypothetical protein [Thermomicrobiales bacterium]
MPLARLAIASLVLLLALAPIWSQIARAQDANGDSPQIVPVTGDAMAVVNGQPVNDGGGGQQSGAANSPSGVQTPVQDPGTGAWVDPNTGFVLDPNLGRWVNPANGQPVLTGWIIDPSTGQWTLGNDGNGVGQPGAVQAAPPPPAPVDQSGQSADTAAAPAAAPQPAGPIQYVHDDARGIWIDPNTGQPPDPASVPYGIDPNTGLAVAADQTWDGGAFAPGSVWTAGPNVFPPSTGAAAAPWSPPRTVYIATTGHSIDGLFLDAWRQWAGEQSWGDPITAEFQQDGNTLQYYDFGRFEYWPSDGSVRFGKIGDLTRPFMIRRGLPGNGNAMADLGRASRAWLPVDPAAAPADSDDSQFVADTDHSVQGAFKQFWQATSGVNYLGNPVTEAYKHGDLTMQVFERGIMIDAPGKGPSLAPIGDLIVKRYGLDTTATPQGNLPDYSETL